MDLMEARRRLMPNGLLPPIYKKCDYLQTTGYNSRIDTGVYGDDATLVFDFDYATIERAAYGAAFGNHVNDSTRGWRLMNPSSTITRYYFAAAYNRRAGSSLNVYVVPEGETFVGKRVNFHVSVGSVTATYGSYSYTATSEADTTTAISTRNIAIGSGNPTQSGSNALVGRFWHFKIWSQNELIRNYIPCVRMSDNKPGFYDTVNNTFNPSIGTVDFIAGYDTV